MNMKPCADPRICGVKNHRPGTVCQAELSQKRGGDGIANASFHAPPPSASQGPVSDDRPEHVNPRLSTPEMLESYDRAFQDKRWIMERDPVAEHLDFDDRIPGTNSHLVRARDDFSTKNLIVREGDFVPIENFPKTNKSIVIPPSEWGDQYNSVGRFRDLKDVEDYLPETVNRSQEIEELESQLVDAYLDRGRRTDVDANIDGHQVTFTFNGDDEYESASEVAHITVKRHDGEVMHGWARVVNGQVSGSFLGDSEGERYTDQLGPYKGHDPESPFPSDRATDYYAERGNRDTFDESAYREQSNSGHTLADYNRTLAKAMTVYRQMDDSIQIYRQEQRQHDRNPESAPKPDRGHIERAMSYLARFKVENDN